jgi:hypothetical protein
LSKTGLPEASKVRPETATTPKLIAFVLPSSAAETRIVAPFEYAYVSEACEEACVKSVPFHWKRVTAPGSSSIAYSEPRKSVAPVEAFWSVSRKINMYMSGVNAGRLLMFTWKVIRPASSLETATLVMSGALASSPTESLNVCELAVVCDDPPSAAGTPTKRVASPSRIASLDLIGAKPTAPIRFRRRVRARAHAGDDSRGP